MRSKSVGISSLAASFVSIDRVPAMWDLKVADMVPYLGAAFEESVGPRRPEPVANVDSRADIACATLG